MIQQGVLKTPGLDQTALEIVTIDSLVPRDHLLRKIDAVIDFSVIHDRVLGLYCAERQLVREIEVNVAYRWFLRLKLTDPVFEASTLSQNRRRRFNDTTVAQDIFDAIVEQAMACGLVDGRERTDAHRLTPWGKAIYKKRKETVERSFADAKQLFGHRYARVRRIKNVATQCPLAAAAQNIKKIAILLTRHAHPTPA